ncbi:MAG: type II toxin-antitoxin system PemK/MazF family toxin [Spirochaetaceae bacterium]|nr:type II toxin-antitoxin system PemK/MazF family toxin [Spirochaetaceae bacterium]MDT8297781.1 type II toxin-antitoxin system PemK/MazF family toxin [Spirochaetaceae bacterium]
MTRGEIWWADFGIPFGNEPGFKRPVLIVQDDDFNKSNIWTVVVVPFSTNLLLADAPGNVLLAKDAGGLSKDSVLVTSQINTIDRARLIKKISKIEKRLFRELEEGMMTVLGIRKFS